MTARNKIHFGKQLLDLIRLHINDEAQSMLNKDFTKTNDEFDTLLHHATNWGNKVIIEYLIELGADIDSLNKDGMTCLMLAVDRNIGCATVKILLEANADIHMTDRQGVSALQMVCDSEYRNTGIRELILGRLKSEINDVEELVDRLMAVGCSLNCAMYLWDAQIIQCMLQRGYDINEKGDLGQTALHLAVTHNDVKLTKLLIQCGADVNAFDETARNPLTLAVYNGHKDTMKLLLEAGADPNVKYDFSLVFLIFVNLESISTEDSDECLELLFQHGAIVERTSQIFRMGLAFDQPKKINMLINYLVMLKELGRPIPDSDFHYDEDKFRLTIAELVDSCEKFLRSAIFGNLTVLDFLTSSEAKMRIHARNNNLVSKLQQLILDEDNKKLFPYYCSIITKRVYKARRTVELEDTAISVISEIMKVNHNLCYIVACKILGYLKEEDLEQLACA